MERYLSAEQVAALVGMSAETVRAWARSGRIPSYRPGGRRWRFLESEVRAAIAQTQKQPAPAVRSARRRVSVVPRQTSSAPVNFREAYRLAQSKAATR